MNHGHIATLYEEVYARPDDDELRLVLADALLAIGDPRGEFIQWQLNPDVDYQRRAMRLVQQYGLTWTGGLRGAVIPLGYERGFLAHCQALDGADDLRDAVEWATISHVELQTPPVGFLLTPIMRSLRTVSNVSQKQLARLTSIPQLQSIVMRSHQKIWRGSDGAWVFPAELEDD